MPGVRPQARSINTAVGSAGHCRILLILDRYDDDDGDNDEDDDDDNDDFEMNDDDGDDHFKDDDDDGANLIIMELRFLNCQYLLLGFLDSRKPGA
ncbi:hypothetical protein ElyMa_000418000 [Elysia marginata]|uniref:Uncharacterized protein n=1 Tax=Elysia marginata TaxID=1093978 RepID=A0AAV4FL11_9GAST|nr:hypothetical protein ElyMa_000418000 [Elysia marginata]